MNEMTEHSARQEQAIEELEAQEKLQETNRELTAILEAEKQHTSIIGALSNVFYGMYFIDLEEKTLREVSSFVSDKLCTLDAVLSTATHFILKKYKDHGTVLSQKKEDEREKITP